MTYREEYVKHDQYQAFEQISESLREPRAGLGRSSASVLALSPVNENSTRADDIYITAGISEAKFVTLLCIANRVIPNVVAKAV